MNAVDVEQPDVHALLTLWRDTRRPIYAVLFLEAHVSQAVTGHVTDLTVEFAVISDSTTDVRIPIKSDELHSALVTYHDQHLHSITIAWQDGKAAFLVTR